MKKIIYFSFVIFSFAAALLSCTRNTGASGASAGETSQDDANRTYRVAYVARAQGDSFAAWLANSIADEAKKNYPNLKIDIFDSQADDSKENAFIENAIANKYDVIVVQPNNNEAQKPYVARAVQAGIPVITTNPRIPGVTGANSVDADPYAQAAVNAQLALTQVPQGASVVVLTGPPGNMHSDVRREAWQKEFFDKRPDVKIAGEQIANWNKDEAIRYMEDWVQALDKIDAIVSMNDNMAAGALEVIKDKPQYANTLAYGVDGTAEAALLIKEGRLTSTSFQNAYLLAQMIVRSVYDIATGKLSAVNIDIDCPLITKENVDMLIAAHQQAGNLQ